MIHRTLLAAMLWTALAAPLTALGGTPLTPVASELLRQYRQEGAGGGFSAERGRNLYLAEHRTRDGQRRSCTTCHTTEPQREGRSDVGKPIAALAPDTNPKRFTDPEEVEKWFRRNCRWVLERTCTPQEKGDFITFLFSLP